MAKRKTIVPDLDNADPIVPEDPDPTESVESAPPLEVADGPTNIDPIAPPVVAEPPKKRRGRPPGSKNSKTADGKPIVKPIIEVEALKKELVQGSAMIATFAHGTKWQKVTDAGALHNLVKVRDEKGEMVNALVPSQRCDIAIGLMGPYMEKSGMLSAAQLSEEGKFAIGCAILIGPPLVATIGLMWEWAFNAKRRVPAKSQIVAVPQSAQNAK